VTSPSHPHPPPIFDFPIPTPPSSPQPKSPVICRPSLPPLPAFISNFVDCVVGDIFATDLGAEIAGMRDSLSYLS
jgi:hypothetical protein